MGVIKGDTRSLDYSSYWPTLRYCGFWGAGFTVSGFGFGVRMLIES